MFLALASSAALAAASSAPVHRAEIAHASRAYIATYHAQPTLHLKQIDPVPAMRQVHALCRWNAELIVNRSVATGGAAVSAIGKSIHRFEPIGGTYVGRCQDVEGRVAAEIARYSAARTGEAQRVAQADRAVLAAEIDGIQTLTKG